MKSEKFILRPGKVCTFDTKNLLNKDNTGIVFVEILEEIPKKRLFGPRWFKIIGTASDANKLTQPIEVPEYLLEPEGMVVIRYPSDLPVVNNIDIAALEEIIRILDSNLNICVPITFNKSLNRLKALSEKLKFYLKMKEV